MVGGCTLKAYDLIRSRRSVYEFEPRPVPRERLVRYIEAAAWAPNHRLTQPWRFVVLPGADLAGAVRTHDERAAGALAGAAAAVAVLQRLDPDAATRGEDALAIGAAVQGLLLCAWDEGVGGLWIGEPAVSDPAVRALAGTAAGERTAALVALGYPEAVPPRRPRRALSELLTWRLSESAAPPPAAAP